VVSVSSSAARGRALEQHVAAYFSHHGYAVETNQVLTGRSGGRHEIDVLAEKRDALTDFRVAVECKAWASPIEKDVVSKLHYVIADLGLHKGIIVSLAGMRSGARVAADELGIDLWGPDELRHHLGEAIFADVAAGAATAGPGTGEIAWGWPFVIHPTEAESVIVREGKGRWGLRTLEATTWLSPLWVPAYLMQLTVAQPVTRRLRHQLESVGVLNVYEALSGDFVARAANPPIEVSLNSAPSVKVIKRETQLHGAMRKAVEARQKVTSAAAIQRHNQNLQRLGLPLPCHSMSIDRTDRVYLPIFAGMLRSGAQDRIVAVNGTTGAVDSALSAVLTSNLGHVRASFRP